MTLTLENKDNAKDVEDWLKQICSRASVDKTTGNIALGTTPGLNESGCDCLKNLIDSKRTTTIHLLPGQHDRCPKPGQKATDKDPKISDSGGGNTVPRDSNGATIDNSGNPGVGSDGQVGSDVDVFIDNSAQARKGYSLDAGEVPNPQWCILAHELTTGHASRCISGMELSPVSKYSTPSGTALTEANWKAICENRAIDSENEMRTAHKDDEGKLKPLPKRARKGMW